MCVSPIKPYTEIYVWLGRDENGYVTNSFEGFNGSRKPGPGNYVLERCGHVSMNIFAPSGSSKYVSFWPAEGVSGSKARLITSIEDDMRNEAPKSKTAETPPALPALPDVIIHLSKLDVPKMLEAFAVMQGRIDRGEITWHFDVPDNKDITDNTNTKANCATFVYTLIKCGGLNIKGHIYNSMWFRNRGPSNPFYKQTRCHLGDILNGMFNGAVWTQSYFTPKALLYHAAAAAAVDPEDKNATVNIMQSVRVANEIREAKRSYVENAHRAVSGASIVFTIVTSMYVAAKRK